jgi:hypothetical protein
LATRLGGIWLVLVAAKALAAAPDPAPATELERAKADMRVLTDGIRAVERIAALADGRAVRASCVAEKLAEARAGVQIGSGELATVETIWARDQSAAAPEVRNQDESDLAYALTRLHLLADRALELSRAARVCVDEDRSSVTVTRVQVEIVPGILPDDPTALPGPTAPALDRPAKN